MMMPDAVDVKNETIYDRNLRGLAPLMAFSFFLSSLLSPKLETGFGRDGSCMTPFSFLFFPTDFSFSSFFRGMISDDIQRWASRAKEMGSKLPGKDTGLLLPCLACLDSN
jgi:hypothetical protein